MLVAGQAFLVVKTAYPTTTTGNGGVQTIITYPTMIIISDIMSERARPRRADMASVAKAVRMKPTAVVTKMSDTIA